MIYDVVNPSDAITLRAPNLQIAFLAIAVLGGGRYGGHAFSDDGARDEKNDIPIFIFGGLDEFWTEHGEGSIEEAIPRNVTELADALESCCLGGVAERAAFDSAVSHCMTPEERETFLVEFNESRRTSMNDIMGRAQKIAAKFRKVPIAIAS